MRFPLTPLGNLYQARQERLQEALVQNDTFAERHEATSTRCGDPLAGGRDAKMISDLKSKAEMVEKAKRLLISAGCLRKAFSSWGATNDK